MRERLIEFLRGRHEVTPATIAKSLGVNRHAVQTELSVLVGLGRVTSSMNSLGVTHYKLAEAVVETKPESKDRTKPFSANRVTGAYVRKGNVVIRLGRRVNARSITLSKQDFDVLAEIYGKSGVFGGS